MKLLNRPRRKTLFVDRQLQGEIIRTAVTQWILFTGAAFSLAFLVQFCLDPFSGLWGNLIPTLRQFAVVLLAFLCLTPVFVYDWLKMSNRIFGPLVRVKRVLGQIAAGEIVEPLSSRKDDSHAELVEQLNELIELVQSESKSGNPEKRDVTV